MKKSFLITISIITLFTLLSPFAAQAQEDNSESKEIKYKARIVDLLYEKCPENYAEGDCYFFDLEIINRDKQGQQVESIVGANDDPKLAALNYKKGQIVYIVETQIAEETQYYVKEPLRKNSQITLVIVFVITVIAIGGLQGFTSLLGLILSFVILILFVIPMMLSGSNPIMASIIGGSLIMTISVYLSHGFNKKTSIALIGTLISLIITAILASIYTKAARLTGYSTDEATFLIQLIDKPLNMQGILLASFIISSIGILDDITVSQVSTIVELFKANPALKWPDLFKRSMKVGRDHISSMVNTLVLAYTGSALPLVMLFIASGASFAEITNVEIVAEEIVRTLVGSIGLILAVPITSLLASYIIAGKEAQRDHRCIKNY